MNYLTNPFRSITITLSHILETLGMTLTILINMVGQYRLIPKRSKAILHQIEICALGGFPVAIIVGVFSGMVLALQAGLAMAEFGQETLVGSIVAASMCREMGPVMTSYILAGLIGSTMAAELGTMKVSEEIDALEVMSINPIGFLVLPRVLALALVCPLLTIYTNLIGILGGGIVSRVILKVNFSLYFRFAQETLTLKDIYSGLFKSLIFGFIIALVSCGQGLNAENGAAGVGKATMKAVVISFIAILIFDYFLTWMFY
ncbi:MAG: ABC transporter permease [Planctomycetes bacterium]|nr:ABC transporter permease [Planctomycetota bacterium]